VVYISYGARELANAGVSAEKQQQVLENYGLSQGEYYLTVGRIAAENNIHVELNGFRRARSDKKLVIVGNFGGRDRYSAYLYSMKANDQKIKFLNPIYDKEVLGILRKSCYAYIHAYQVGGTNPSLLEQMLFGRPIIAYDVPFHREVLQGGGIYFRDEQELAECLAKLEHGEFDLDELSRWQARRIEQEYNWDHVAERYNLLFRALLMREKAGSITQRLE
jgi:glycosyltransferase involved in cell wall biosynthesis